MEAAVPLLAIAAPFLLWPVEMLAPYPHIFEEVFKLALVLIILNRRGPAFRKITLGVASGVLFALSESFLYFLNIFQAGQPSLFVQRLTLTIPLHGATIMLMILPALKKREFVLVGFLLAVALHYVYNLSLINLGPGA